MNNKIVENTLWKLVMGKKPVITCILSSTIIYSAETYADRAWNYSYNSLDLVETADGPRAEVNDITTYGYDSLGKLASITNAHGHVTQLSNYNATGLPLQVTDVNGTVSLLEYNFKGAITKRTVKSSQGDAVTLFDYDPIGQLLKITLPDGAFLGYEYDDAHRLIAVSNSIGERIEFSLDDMGNKTQEQIKNSSGSVSKVQNRVFDELGRLIRSIGSSNQTTQMDYDKNSNIVSVTDGRSNTSSRGFDALNRLILVTDAKLGITRLEYNPQDNLIGVTDPRGLKTGYQYNGLGDRVQQDSPDTGITLYEHDNAGNITKKTDARNVVTLYSYDALNRLLQVSFPANTSENITYSYDDIVAGNKGIGRLTGITDQSGSTHYKYDDRGNVIQESRTIESQNYVTTYSYDLADKLTQMVYPSGRIVGYSYNSSGQLISISTQESAVDPIQTVVQNITYLPFGPVSSMTYGNGVVRTLDHDQDYQLASVSSAILNLAYGYDATGNIEQITNSIDSSKNQQFIYDELSRLTQSQGVDGTIDYQYDAVGNRTNRSQVNSSNSLTKSYTYALDSNRLQQVDINKDGTLSQRTINYTQNGNIQQDQTIQRNLEMVYGQQNRLEEIKKDGSSLSMYVHNALGQRVVKVAIGPISNQHFHYDLNGLMISETSPDGEVLRENIYLNGAAIAVIASDIPPSPSTDTFTVQAESGELNSHVVDTNNAGYEGSGFVDIVGEGELSYTVNASAGGYQLGIRYALGATANRPLLIEVNGVIVSTLDFAPTGSWTNWLNESQLITLIEGDNSIKLITTGSSGANIDQLTFDIDSTPPVDISTVITYQAEDGQLSSHVVDTNNAGYKGTGFVDMIGEGELAITIMADAGSYNLEIRYALDATASRPLLVEINGTVINTLSFSPTGSWTTWLTESQQVTLVEGDNSIKLLTTGASGANIDQFKLTLVSSL